MNYTLRASAFWGSGGRAAGLLAIGRRGGEEATASPPRESFYRAILIEKKQQGKRNGVADCIHVVNIADDGEREILAR